MERPTSDDESMPEPANKHEAHPETPAQDVEVTPLDEEEHIKEGIEVEER
jgi:hypothetical protein